MFENDIEWYGKYIDITSAIERLNNWKNLNCECEDNCSKEKANHYYLNTMNQEIDYYLCDRCHMENQEKVIATFGKILKQAEKELLELNPNK